MGYLSQARGRANLEIRSGVQANRVLFDGDRARAVQVVKADGTTEEISARHIILAAGAVNSPAMLLRSGIGPANDLRRLGIDVVLDREGVGATLIDHRAR